MSKIFCSLGFHKFQKTGKGNTLGKKRVASGHFIIGMPVYSTYTVVRMQIQCSRCGRMSYRIEDVLLDDHSSSVLY